MIIKDENTNPFQIDLSSIAKPIYQVDLDPYSEQQQDSDCLLLD